MQNKEELLKKLPAVDKVLNLEKIQELYNLYGRNLIVDTIRDVINEKRNKILNSESVDCSIYDIVETVEQFLYEKNLPNLKRVINGTGVIIHTNIGRSPLCDEAIKHIIKISKSYCNLEMDLESGERSTRQLVIRDILVKLTNTESCFIVNNNTAAVLVAVSTLAKNKEVIVSRGQLIEIGGSFRLPEIIAQSGAKLVEVGTTNKTYLKDYENAINENTALLMRSHTSNYKIMGFTEEVSAKKLAELGKKYGIPSLEDLGSGLFIDLSGYGLPYEPTVLDSIKAGIDIITFSGDKLLGGPQAGIIIGKKELIEKIQKNPLTRAIRIDKLCLAALESTLRLYFVEEKVYENIPVLKLLTISEEEIYIKASKLANVIKEKIKENADVYVKKDVSEAGGGSLPLTAIPTFVICIKPQKISVKELALKLRKNTIPIIGRIKEDCFILDLRTCFFENEEEIISAVKKILVN